MGTVKAGDDIFFTWTMAEILEKQGHMEDALAIYKILSDTDPTNLDLAVKVEGLKRLAARRVSRERPRTQPAPATDAGER
jgi:hypothetical protein